MALGSIFLALFSYVVNAKLYFEDSQDLTCRRTFTAEVYAHFFFPFVSGFIIVSSCLSICISQRQFWTFNAKLMSLAMAAFPWLLALLVICPLAFVGTDWEKGCRQEVSLGRQRAIYIIGLVLPVIAALVFSIGLNVMKKATNTQRPFPTAHNILTDNIPDADTTGSNTSLNCDLPMSNVDTTRLLVSERTQPHPGILETTQYPLEHPQSQQGPPLYPQQYPQQ